MEKLKNKAMMGGREGEKKIKGKTGKKKKGRKERRKIWMPSKFECQINNNF